MKLTTKNLLLILVVLGAAYAVTQLTKRSGRSKSLRSELVAIDTSRVSEITISSLEGEVLLSKADEAWNVRLADGSQKLAKKTAVVGLLNSLNTIEPGRLAAKTEDKWKDYAVDSAGTRVRVLADGKVAADIIIGRFGMENQQSFYTFVRLFEDKEVYVAKGFMGMSVGKDAASYRENMLLRLNEDSLSSISFNYPDSAFSLTKGEQWYLADQVADSAAVMQYLSGLGYVSSREFYDQELPGNPTHSAVFTFSNQPEITVYGYASESSMVLNSSENPQEFFMDDVAADKVFKSQSAFLTTPE